MTKRVLIVSLIAGAGLLGSCTIPFKPEFDVANIRTEEKRNGYLIELEPGKKIGDVVAFISKDNWLIITLVGARVDFDHLRTMEPNELISTFQVIGSRTSVQLSLKLKKDFRSCEVVRDQSSNEVSIALFSK